MDYDASLFSRAIDMNKGVTKQKRDFVKRFAALMKWNSGEDLVMDIGCGSGDITYKDLLPAIPEGKTIIAMDLLPEMINFATLHYFHPKIEYHVADITKLTTLEKWRGKIPHTFSAYCLQRVKDQEGAFKNIFSLLKANGEAALLFLLSDSLYDCYDDIINSPKWKKFIEDTHTDVPESHTKGYKSDHYKGILEKIGFEVLICEEEYMDVIFEEDDHAKESFASYTSCICRIPEELKEEFKNDLFEIFIKHNGRDTNNYVVGKYHTLALHLRKPLEYST